MKLLIRLSPILGLAVVLCLVALRGETTTQAYGGLLGQITAVRTGTACASTDAAGNHAGVGVGIAFKSPSLLISCATDNTVTVISPFTGLQVPSAPPGGLYLANDGCSQIYSVPRTFTSSTLFVDASALTPSPPRLEGLACDGGLRFSPTHGALWSIDAYDNVLRAWDAFGCGNVDIVLTDTPTPTPACSITVIKDSVPDNPLDFTFDTTGSSLPPSFTLADTNKSFPNTQTFGVPCDDSHHITEETPLPPGWTLKNIVCTGGVASTVIFYTSGASSFRTGDTGVLIRSAAEENVTCTFTNCLKAQTPTPVPDSLIPDLEAVKCAVESVGGASALTVSDSGSPVPWTPLAAVAAGVMAVMGAGFWYSRRRWLR